MLTEIVLSNLSVEERREGVGLQLLSLGTPARAVAPRYERFYRIGVISHAASRTTGEYKANPIIASIPKPRKFFQVRTIPLKSLASCAELDS
jgi:hypothetical protein